MLRRTQGQWQASRLIGWGAKKAVPLSPPTSGWPTFSKELGRLRVFELPDQNDVRDRKGYREIMDGYSTLVEYQKDGVYRAYAYNNPGNQATWAPAKPMAALDVYLRAQFPN